MKPKTKLKLHPYCELFPQLPPEKITELAGRIKANGQLDDIVLLEGKILDGRNRYLACLEAGVEPRTVGFVGADPLEFVIDKNLTRRHLTESQKALIAADYATRKRGQHDKDSNRSTDPFEAGTIAEAAEKLNISEGSVKRGKTVREKGSKSIQKLVKDGELSVSAAATVAKLPKEKQSKLAARGAEAVKNAAAKLTQRPPRGGFKHETPPEPVDTGAAYVRGAKPPARKTATEDASELAPVTCAEDAIARIEFFYNMNKAKLNTPPPPTPRAVCDMLIEFLRA